MHGARSLSIGHERLRIIPWRGDATTAYVVARTGSPTTGAVGRCVDELATAGYRAALTTALPPGDHAPFVANGFTIHERLHLLSLAVDPLPELDREVAVLRRGRRRDRARVLAVDGAAFPTFWRLDEAGLDDALGATPSARFRVALLDADDARPERIAGYAVTGRAGARGYLQRLAVEPSEQRHGLGSALVLDALRWLRRWGAHEVLVNTQEDNLGAVALYERLGFRRQPDGLAVLRRAFDGSDR